MQLTGGFASVTASWNAAEGNGATVTGYRVTADPGPATCTTTGETTCVLGGAPGTAYTVTVVALSAGGESPASAPSNSVAPSALPISTTPPAGDGPLDTGNGPISTARPGESIELQGSGYAPFSSVTIAVYSTPIVLGTATADGQGSFQESVTVPPGLASGKHSLVAAGVDADGQPRALRLDVTVSSSGGSGTLPITGPGVLGLLVGGFALALAGLAMRMVRRQ